MRRDKKILPINHPNVLKIEIQENNEPLIDIRELGGIAIGPSPEIPNNQDYFKMRKKVYTMLVEAQKLLPKSYKLCLYEAYRSGQLQKKLFEEWLSVIMRTYPDKSYVDQFHETIKLVSPSINLDGSKNISPHLTGGALDLYLIDEENNIIDMGLHPANWMSDVNGSIASTYSKKISEASKHNREIMVRCLEKVGFVNYRGEYWHWSYGDKYWAYHTKQKHAIYGAI